MSGERQDKISFLAPLAVTLSAFEAEREDNTIHFAWETATELGNAGFNVLVETDNGLVRVNDELIPSIVIDSVAPTNYSYEAEVGGSEFYLELVSINGSSEMFGPLTEPKIAG